ncbi:MAG: PorP/SprF family type IX secretion system membrane protein [Bacteroidetes bacterium]|nr:PorP/SprF family type IX secretion system membrane protein [Bacteroidota bacterium]
MTVNRSQFIVDSPQTTDDSFFTNNEKMKTMSITSIRLALLTLFTFSFSLLTNAQQLPLYSSYVYNPFLLSPSNAGNMEYAGQSARLMLGHRYQYAGFEGAPSTSVLTLDAPITKNMGLGGTLYTDKMGLIRHTGGELGYSYTIHFNKVEWALGASVQAGQQSLDMESAVAQDMNENILNLLSANKTFISGGFGTHFNINKLTFGVTAQHLTQNRLVYQNFTSNSNYEFNMATQWLAHASYKLRNKNGKWGVQPMIVARMMANIPTQFDAIAKVDYKQKLFLTAGYRGGYAASFGAGARLNDNLVLSYTYDHMVNDAGPFTGGGNEFTLGYNFFKGKKAPVFDEPTEPSETTQGLSQEEVDRLFDEKLADMREKMEKLLNENERQQDELDRLSNKVDSLKMSNEELEAAAKTVNVKDGFVANNLLFNTGSAWLSNASKAELDRITAYLMVNEGVNLSIVGHADATGNSESNLMLSKMRAENVYDYLVARGIRKSRLSHQSYGDTKPVADNDSETGRSQNRRVELKIR